MKRDKIKENTVKIEHVDKKTDGAKTLFVRTYVCLSIEK